MRLQVCATYHVLTLYSDGSSVICGETGTGDRMKCYLYYFHIYSLYHKGYASIIRDFWVTVTTGILNQALDQETHTLGFSHLITSCYFDLDSKF